MTLPGVIQKPDVLLIVVVCPFIPIGIHVLELFQKSRIGKTDSFFCAGRTAPIAAYKVSGCHKIY